MIKLLVLDVDGTLTDAERAAIWPLVEFTVTNGAGTAVATVRGDAMAQGSTGAERTLVLHLPLSDSTGRTERYTVTETAHAAPAGLLYLGSRTALNGEDWQTALFARVLCARIDACLSFFRRAEDAAARRQVLARDWFLNLPADRARRRAALRRLPPRQRIQYRCIRLRAAGLLYRLLRLASGRKG